MGTLPVLKAKEVVAILELLGFNEIRQKRLLQTILPSRRKSNNSPISSGKRYFTHTVETNHQGYRSNR
jgi:hypothetical protein